MSKQRVRETFTGTLALAWDNRVCWGSQLMCADFKKLKNGDRVRVTVERLPRKVRK